MTHKLTMSAEGIHSVVVRQGCFAFFGATAYLLICQLFGHASLVPLGGMLMAVLLADKRHVLIPIFCGVATGQLMFMPVPQGVALLSLILGTMEALLAVWLLRTYKKFDSRLEKPQSFFVLCLVSLATPTISSLCIMLFTWLQSGNGQLQLLISRYWATDSLGMVLMSSAALIWNTVPKNWARPTRVLEYGGLILLSFLIGQAIFLGRYHSVFGNVDGHYWMFLVVLVAAMRIGRHGVVVILSQTAILALLGAHPATTELAGDLDRARQINDWNFLATLTVVGMAFAIMLKNWFNNESALRYSQHRLIEIQKLAEIANWTWEIQTDTHYWSPEIYEVYGRDPRQGPALYPEVQNYFTSASWRQLAEAVEQCLHSGLSYACDAEVVRPDGTRRWIIARGEATRDAQGKIIRLFGTVQDITARKLAQLQTLASESNFRMLFENSPTAMLSVDSNTGQIMQANGNASRLWGYSVSEFTTLSLRDITYPDDILSSLYRLESIKRGEYEHGGQVEKRYLRKNGTFFWADATFTVVRDDSGQPRYGIASIFDITEHKKVEQQNIQLSMTVEQSPESIVITDTEANMEYVNESFIRKSGYSREELIGQNSRLLRSGKTPQSTYQALWRSLERGEVWEGEFINRSKTGQEYIEHAIISPIRQSDGCITHYVAVKEDITEKIRSKKQLHRLAYFDQITELPNFVMLQEHIAESLLQTRHANSFGGLITFNIDRFKTVNDANGQAMANLLLKLVGERLVYTLYASDVVARISSDEFGILFCNLANSLQPAALIAMQISQKIHNSMRKPFLINDKEIILTSCHGIAVFSGADDDNPYEIVQRASTAMHHAKSHGFEQTVFFESSLEQVVKRRFSVEGELRKAIKGNELRVYLQSQVDSHGTVQGAEALIRWQHPLLGLITPIQFIPVAEESNLIVDIDNWVLDQVCSCLARNSHLPYRLSVNISARHFNQLDFVAQVSQIVALTGADPNRLTLEITESVVIGNLDDVIAKTLALSELGIHFSMDDFGTGYSSLSYLKRLPIHELKIDKSFIQEATSDSNDAALVEVILSVARHLNLDVVAEGVETPAQAAFLNQRAQVLHQGYLYSIPEPMEQWLERLAVQV